MPQTGKLEDVLDAGKNNNTVNGHFGFAVREVMLSMVGPG
jgi:hypothetical protein